MPGIGQNLARHERHVTIANREIVETGNDRIKKEKTQ